MNPIPTLRLAVVIALATLACEARAVGPASVRDVVSEDAHDAAVADGEYAPCVGEINGGICGYQGYGSTCVVSCRVAPSCTFRLAVTWQGGNYCCLVSSDGPGRENFPFCNCIDGRVLCTSMSPGVVRQELPTSYCEFCDRGRDR